MTGQFWQDACVFSPELVLLVGALGALMAGTYVRDGYAAAQRIAYVALFGALALVCLIPANGAISYGLNFATTAATQFAKFWVFAAAIGALTLAHHALARAQVRRFEFPVLILLSALGMCLMISARDFMVLYVSIELQSLPLYILAAFVRHDERSAEAGLKYFVLGALSSGLLLYGISLLYGATGSIQYGSVATFINSGAPSMAVTLALVFILAAVAFKISAAPFHMWTPDVYQGAATPITAFFTTAPKVAGAMVVLQLLHGPAPLGGAHAAWEQILWAAAALSLIVGAFAALMQQNIKRLLAYSTINHVGFLLIAILAGGTDGAAALLVYLGIYVIISLGTFGGILLLQQQGEATDSIADLTGLARRKPRIALAMAVLMFAAAGIPPTAGFLSKMFVLLAAMHGGYAWLAALGVVTSVVATFYYLRIIKLMYFDDAVASIAAPLQKPSRRLVALLIIMTALTLGLMVFPSAIVAPATDAAQAITANGGR